MINYDDTIGNGTCDLPACIAVPQTTAPPCAHYPSKCLAQSISFNLFVVFVNGSVTSGFLKMKEFMIYKTRFVFKQWAVLYLELFFPRLRQVWVGLHGQLWGFVSTHFLCINTGKYNFDKIKLNFLFSSPCECNQHGIYFHCQSSRKSFFFWRCQNIHF